jgi:hypothetical protein
VIHADGSTSCCDVHHELMLCFFAGVVLVLTRMSLSHSQCKGCTRGIVYSAARLSLAWRLPLGKA